MDARETGRPANPLRDVLHLVLRHKWSILAIAALVLGATLFLSFRKTPSYQATARVLVRSFSDDPNAFYTINLETERGLVASAAVAEVVKTNVSSPRAANDLLSGLTVSVEPETEILLMQYTSDDPVVARDMANAFATAYLEFRRENAVADYQVEASEISKRVMDLKEEQRALTARLTKTNDVQRQSAITGQLSVVGGRLAILQEDLAALGSPETLSTSGGDVLQPASIPTSPSSPNHVRDGIMGLFLGLALGVGIAFARDNFDDRIQGSPDLEAHLRAPVLATIPRTEDWRRRDTTQLTAIETPRSAAAEAYRALRTNLQFLARKDGVRVITVTSPYLGEGKTTTVANLAVTLAQAGKRVVAVSCDLRRPRLHRFFGLHNEYGLSDVLLGDASLPQIAQEVEGFPTIRVLAGGPVPANPAELLGSDAMDHLIADLRSASDYVLLDSPPLLAVADSLIVGPKGDGVLIVVDATSTPRGSIDTVRDQLEQVDGSIIGGVFNNFDPGRARYYYSGDYRTHYPYTYDDDGKRNETDDDGRPWQPEDIWTAER